MTNQSGATKPTERHAVKVRIGNTSETLRTISAAIARRACEIRLHRGSRLGRDQENWRLAESEILQPLGSCGILESKDEAVISLFCSALGAKDIEEIEVCAEPRRVILVGKKGSSTGSGEGATLYRVLALAEEFDPSSVNVTSKQHGSLIEIHIHRHGKETAVEREQLERTCV